MRRMLSETIFFFSFSIAFFFLLDCFFFTLSLFFSFLFSPIFLLLVFQMQANFATRAGVPVAAAASSSSVSTSRARAASAAPSSQRFAATAKLGAFCFFFFFSSASASSSFFDPQFTRLDLSGLERRDCLCRPLESLDRARSEPMIDANLSKML